MMFDIDPVKFDSMLNAMKSWRFNESGDVMPEDEDYDGFADLDVDDGQPDHYTEMQDYMGGDDWDHGQYDEY